MHMCYKAKRCLSLLEIQLLFTDFVTSLWKHLSLPNEPLKRETLQCKPSLIMLAATHLACSDKHTYAYRWKMRRLARNSIARCKRFNTSQSFWPLRVHCTSFPVSSRQQSTVFVRTLPLCTETRIDKNCEDSPIIVRRLVARGLAHVEFLNSGEHVWKF